MFIDSASIFVKAETEQFLSEEKSSSPQAALTGETGEMEEV